MRWIRTRHIPLDCGDCEEITVMSKERQTLSESDYVVVDYPSAVLKNPSGASAKADLAVSLTQGFAEKFKSVFPYVRKTQICVT